MKKILSIFAMVIVLGGSSSGTIAKANTLDKAISVEKVNSLELTMTTTKLNKVIKYLKTRNNKTRYVYSGMDPIKGWDCSGLVSWTYKQLNIDIEHSATKQAYSGAIVKTPKIGDIVVFGYKNSYDHSAIYIGNNKVINSNSYFGITKIESLKAFKRYSKIVFVRVIDTL